MPKKDAYKKGPDHRIGADPDRAGSGVRLLGKPGMPCHAGGGCEVVLVNSNPATIQTDPEMADVIYIEPLRADIIAKIIEKEKPDGILSGMGGQTGLNMTAELAEKGALKDVEILGTPLEAIYKGEDREKFRNLMLEIGEPVPKSIILTSLAQIEEAIRRSRAPCGCPPGLHAWGSRWRYRPHPRGTPPHR